ncbi:transposase zinc-binding domain-containing protein [Sorangium sp. So ce321]|uniref:transposase zinc-binding domain-containing protein n=1 Tax=Sorangium sp. So ce321 TaxID=3133300 RepID=UPI003F6012D2
MASPGIIRFHCDERGQDLLVAFSCKGRGLCPSYGARQMCNTAAHLVDRVLPAVPVRQWVISLPLKIRGLAAFQVADPSVHAPTGSFHVGREPLRAALPRADMDNQICEVSSRAAAMLSSAAMASQASWRVRGRCWTK